MCGPNTLLLMEKAEVEGHLMIVRAELWEESQGLWQELLDLPACFDKDIFLIV